MSPHIMVIVAKPLDYLKDRKRRLIISAYFHFTPTRNEVSFASSPHDAMLLRNLRLKEESLWKHLLLMKKTSIFDQTRQCSVVC